MGTKQSFNVPLNQRTSRQVDKILAEHTSIPNENIEENNNYVDRELVETQLSVSSPDKPSEDKERSLSAGR